MRMRNNVINFNDINNDYLIYEYYINSDANTSNQKESMLRFLKNAIDIALTDKQKMYFIEYFINGKSIKEIAEQTNRDTSTFSRQITRSKERIRKFAPLYFNK